MNDMVFWWALCIGVPIAYYLPQIIGWEIIDRRERAARRNLKPFNYRGKIYLGQPHSPIGVTVNLRPIEDHVEKEEH